MDFDGNCQYWAEIVLGNTSESVVVSDIFGNFDRDFVFYFMVCYTINNIILWSGVVVYLDCFALL